MNSNRLSEIVSLYGSPSICGKENSEKRIQTQIVSALIDLAIQEKFFGVFFHIPNERILRKNDFSYFNSLKSQGLACGVPDLRVIGKAPPQAKGCLKTVFLEVKTKNNKTTEKQNQFIAELKRIDIPRGNCLFFNRRVKFSKTRKSN